MADHGVLAHSDADLERPELERPGLVGRTLWLGTRLLAACTAFYFLGFLFAFVYLKTLNTNGQWRPRHVHASGTVGAVVLLLVLASVVAFVVAVRALTGGRWRGWRVASATAAALGLAAVIVQIVQLIHPGFPNGTSGYASVFVGWQWSIVVALLCGLYAVLTLISQSFRMRPETRVAADDLTSPAALTAMAAALRFMLVLVAGVELLAWALLYLVR